MVPSSGGGMGEGWCGAFRRRRRKPGGSSTAARNRPQSEPGSRRRQGHDGAWYTLLVRRSSQLIKTFGTSPLTKQVMQGRKNAVAEIRSATEHPQKRGRGKSRLPPVPSPLSTSRTLQSSFAPPRTNTKRRTPLHSQKDF